MKRSGVTLVEMMVATFILSLISVPLYYVLKQAQHRAALAACKDYVKQESNKVLKIVEHDLSQARRESFKQPSDDVFEIKVPKQGSDKDLSLRYLFIKPDLKRIYDGKQWLVSNNVDEFVISTTPDAPGRLVVSLKTKANFDGVKEEDAPVLSQEKLVVMREDAAFEKDEHWRDVGDVNKFFASQGSLMGGIKEDAGKLVQDFTSEWSAAAGDIQNMTIGQLKKVKDDLFNGLKDVEDSINSLDKDILDLDPKAMFDVGCDGKLSDSQKDRAKAVKNALANMKNKGDMSWQKVVNSGGGGFFSSKMKTGAIKEFYNAKAQLFNSGQEVVKQIDSFKKLSSEKGFDFDTSQINRGKWGL
ncbi:MAG: type II secretion system protein [Candidatus Rifleibacteriota bacterium]